MICLECGGPRDYVKPCRPNYVQAYCRACTNARMRRTRRKHSELSKEARRKNNIRDLARHYVRTGKIKRESCIVCGLPKAQMHHPDYSKPLEVIWYCQKHHAELHRKLKEEIVD